jgi:hypothetical protein
MSWDVHVSNRVRGLEAVEIRPPLDEGHEELFRIVCAQLGLKVLLLESNGHATTCQLKPERGRTTYEAMNTAFDPNSQGLVHFR